jgi:hypothetical protein
MAKFMCSCGHIIRDQSDRLPYKAMFIPDEDDEACFDGLANQVVEFIQARERGQQDAFISKYFGEEFPRDEDEFAIVGYLVSYPVAFGRHIYECENCGRVWIQKHAELDHNLYASYLPEGDIRGVLKSQRRVEEGTSSEEEV